MNARLGRNTHPIANIQMSGQTNLSTQLNTVPDYTTTRNTGLRDNYAAFTNPHVVPDLHQIINPRPCANNGIRPCPAVDGRICAHLHVIFDQNTTELRYSHSTDRRHGKSESRFSDPNASEQRDMVPNNRKTNRHLRADRAVVTNPNPAADIDIRSDPTISSNFHIGANDCASANYGPGTDTC
jgi:hypothetical protein